MISNAGLSSPSTDRCSNGAGCGPAQHRPARRGARCKSGKPQQRQGSSRCQEAAEQPQHRCMPPRAQWPSCTHPSRCVIPAAQWDGPQHGDRASSSSVMGFEVRGKRQSEAASVPEDISPVGRSPEGHGWEGSSDHICEKAAAVLHAPSYGGEQRG